MASKAKAHEGTLPGTHTVTGCVSLSEATAGADKGIAEATVLCPGFNTSKTAFYPAAVLARDFAVFEGAKMFADHPTAADAKARPERSIRDWVGTLHGVRVDESGAIRGSPKIHANWMRDLLGNLREAGALPEMGVSINASAKVRDTKIEGHQTRLVEALIQGQSVDFVTFPGAGGRVHMYESETEGDMPDNAHGAQEGETKMEEELKKLQEGMAALGEAVKALQETLGLKDKEVAEAKAERDKLATQIAEADKAAALAKVQEAVVKAIDESKLPDSAKAKLREAHKADTDASGIGAAIEAEASYIATLKPEGKVKGLGGETDTTGVAALFEAAKARYIEEGYRPEIAETMARAFVS